MDQKYSAVIRQLKEAINGLELRRAIVQAQHLHALYLKDGEAELLARQALHALLDIGLDHIASSVEIQRSLED